MIRLLALITLPLYLLDQWSKNWIVQRFELNGPGEEVIPGTFMLHHVANTGVAFGMFNGTAYANYAFTLVSLFAFSMIVLGLRRDWFPNRLSRLAAALLISGIFGNLTDRLLRSGENGRLFEGGLLKGYVVDFLYFDFGFPPFNPWPSFNVADSCVVFAAVLLGISSFQVPVSKAGGPSKAQG